MKKRSRLARALAALALATSPIPGIGENAAPFATVGDAAIEREEFEAAVTAGVRQKFYHGRVPEQELAAYRREVGERLVERALLLAEAKRRGLEPDRAAVEAEIAQYERRYASSERWRAERERLLPPLVAELERQSVLRRLEDQVRAVPAADEAQVQAFYASRPELFTEPEQLRLRIIVLAVDPSSPKQAWEQAREEAARLRSRAARGADFGELARLHSSDASAANDGDLGYLHRGMLPAAIDALAGEQLKPGEVSEPLRVLEGYALVRLEDRRPAELRRFADVKARAAELDQRSRGEAQWQALRAALREGAAVRVDESAYRVSGAQ